MIIGLIGQKQQGKSTFANHIIKEYGFEEYSFAGSLKEACKIIFCLDDEQMNGSLKETMDERWGMSPRDMFVEVGTSLFREHLPSINSNFNEEIGENIWVKRFEFWYAKWNKENPNKNLVVSDVRFMNEARVIKNLGGTLIGIKGKVHFHEAHITEMLINYCPCKIYIENKGTLEEYYENIDDLMKKI